jgi:hypothetical protein
MQRDTAYRDNAPPHRLHGRQDKFDLGVGGLPGQVVEDKTAQAPGIPRHEHRLTGELGSHAGRVKEDALASLFPVEANTMTLLPRRGLQDCSKIVDQLARVLADIGGREAHGSPTEPK